MSTTKIRFIKEFFTQPGHLGNAGDAMWVVTPDGTKIGIEFVCPKCLHLGGVRFPPWTWDGNEIAPTTRASILHDSESCGWHGYLTVGEFVEL